MTKNPATNPEWIKKMSELEDGCDVTVGLVHEPVNDPDLLREFTNAANKNKIGVSPRNYRGPCGRA